MQMKKGNESMGEHATDIYLVLCDIRSAHNVGTILRTADAVGVKEVMLCGYTPDPIDRFGRKRADIAKAALGAEESMRWRHGESSVAVLSELRSRGVTLVALEQTGTSVPYMKFCPEGPVALIVGNEIQGVPQEVCEMADVCIEIPMSGAKESLNVAVATGVALFHVRYPFDCF